MVLTYRLLGLFLETWSAWPTVSNKHDKIHTENDVETDRRIKQVYDPRTENPPAICFSWQNMKNSLLIKEYEVWKLQGEKKHKYCPEIQTWLSSVE